MKRLGCKGIFKTKNGLICHLSKKLLCQHAMGMAVTPLHPPIQTFALQSPPVKMHPKKKHPTPPQQLHTTTIDTTYQTIQCLGCDGIFKKEQGIIRHLSKKIFCQKAMGFRFGKCSMQLLWVRYRVERVSQ
jgi:uncharacterized C2H2 Zn-finger protein